MPEQHDGVPKIWNSKHKRYLIITVDESPYPDTTLPFTKTDGTLVAQQLAALGYRSLIDPTDDNPHGLLVNPDKNRVHAALKRIRGMADWASIVIYYSGHGVASPKNNDVSLQLAGQADLDFDLGYQIAALLEAARHGTNAAGEKLAYQGELHLIADACFSGAAAGKLPLKDLGEKTTILASSSNTGTSHPITLADGTKLSAFTHFLLQGMGPAWSAADSDRDGILRFGEVHRYTANQLRQWYRTELPKRKQADPENASTFTLMKPKLVGGRHEEVLLAYDRTRATRWDTEDRRSLNFVVIERKLVPPSIQVAASGQQPVPPPVSDEAQAISTQVKPDPSDPYEQGLVAQAQGRIPEAEALFAQAQQAEAEHEERLAKIYLARGRNATYAGKYKEALPWYQKRVALRPSRDPALLNEFGQAWDRAGRYNEALPFYQEALEIREATLVPNDSDLAVSLNNLAGLYQAQEKYADAEPLYQRALDIDEAALGPNHPNLAIDLNNLALLYQKQRQYTDAEPLYQRALAIREAALGNNHPDVAQSLNNLALLYKTQGKYADAEPLYRRAYIIMKARFDLKHPATKTVLKNYADLLQKAERTETLLALRADLLYAFPGIFAKEAEAPMNAQPQE